MRHRWIPPAFKTSPTFCTRRLFGDKDKNLEGSKPVEAPVYDKTLEGSKPVEAPYVYDKTPIRQKWRKEQKSTDGMFFVGSTPHNKPAPVMSLTPRPKSQRKPVLPEEMVEQMDDDFLFRRSPEDQQEEKLSRLAGLSEPPLATERPDFTPLEDSDKSLSSTAFPPANSTEDNVNFLGAGGLNVPATSQVSGLHTDMSFADPLPRLHNTTKQQQHRVQGKAITNVKRIFILRHGESTANVDMEEFCRTPDWKIPLTPLGVDQARSAGRYIKSIVGDELVFFYVSPYLRSYHTMRYMVYPDCLDPTMVHLTEGKKPLFNIDGVQEDPRLRDEDYGHLSDYPSFLKSLKARRDYGRFFYRFPNGESGADVCDRVTGFLDAFQRQQDVFLPETNVVIVTHGITTNMLIKRWFHLTVEHFEQMNTIPNGKAIRLDRVPNIPNYFMLDSQSLKWLNVPTSLHSGNGYALRNKAILGSISLGAPYL